MNNKEFKFVDYLWDTSKAEKINKDEVALLLYRSNLLGTDLRITNYGGGNTSCKTMENDPLTKKETEVMYVKGSGGDIGTLKRNGLAGLYMDRLNDLKNVYRGLEHEDEMVALFDRCIFDLDSKAPSIDTALHAFLPFKHIDHLHPDAVIAIAAAEDSKALTKEIWGEDMGWLAWQRPGFDLGLQLSNLVAKNPNINGIILQNHGLFTWGDTSYECYINSLEAIEKAAAYLDTEFQKKDSFGGEKIKSLTPEKRKEQAGKIAPILRGFCSREQKMIGHFTDDARVLEFTNSNDLDKLAPMGTSCPDHFLRTKIKPLVLNLAPDENLEDTDAIIAKVQDLFDQYVVDYKAYYDKHKHNNSPAMRDPNPIVILYPGVGMFTFAKNKQTTRVASEFYINAINVMKGAEAVSNYTSLPLQEAFDIEYWLLEEAKLIRQPAEKPLSRQIALITGAGGGIGKAIAEKLVAEGAVVVMTDINEDNLKESASDFGTDDHIYVVSDVTSKASIENAVAKANIEFGGVDILVHSAGIAISKSIENTTEQDWDILQNILVKGQFLLAQSASAVMRQQKLGGNIINIASKNGLVSGPNNVAYGTAKAAQLHMSRLMAAELGADKIRVNVVNPDAVIVGSKIWEGKWAEGRAKAYGISV
ncbi:MAG: bifunctional rhamnulose-1-phosphate aldolase/short-chain dehydrogenase, partial [Bacteroidales bacterium]|nr:bifunctional rhamnulose-1-phosphate aldolase/short-chain dehydrogenase [Bacteroidales bacterium]